MTTPVFISVYGPPDWLPRYTLYPITGELLAVQESLAWCWVEGGPTEVMTNVTVFDFRPVLVSMTLTVAVPAAATSEGAMVATARVELTIWVGRWLPFHSTAQVGVKFEPATVRLNPPLPATVLAGERLPLSCGAGLGAGLGAWLFESVQPASDKSSRELIHIFFTVFPGCPPWGEGRNRLPFHAGLLD